MERSGDKADEEQFPLGFWTMSFTERFTQIRDRVDAAAREAGRDPSDVRILPVSKTFPAATVAGAWSELQDFGCDTFAENRVQEASEKASLLDGPRWAIIGPLQTNKASQLVAFASEFHALDRPKVAGALQRKLEEADRTLEVFIQVNSSDEPQKAGFTIDEAREFAAELGPEGPYPRLIPRGFMTMAMLSTDDDAIRRCFSRTRALRDEVADGDFLSELSMGMSGDFELAIAEGATTIRVGQAIFGERPAN